MIGFLGIIAGALGSSTLLGLVYEDKVMKELNEARQETMRLEMEKLEGK